MIYAAGLKEQISLCSFFIHDLDGSDSTAIKYWGSGLQPSRAVKRILRRSAAENRMWDWQDQEGRKEGRKLPCEPETQPGLLPLACWVGSKQCQKSGDEHKARVGRTCGFCSHLLFPEQEMQTLPQQAASHGLTQKQSLRQANGPSLQPHLMSRIMVQAAYLYRVSLRLWYDTIQVTSCIEHLTFLGRFGLFSPKTTFWAVVKLYFPQAPVTSISTAEWKTTFFFLAVFNFPNCFILSCPWVERLWIIILFSSSAD